MTHPNSPIVLPETFLSQMHMLSVSMNRIIHSNFKYDSSLSFPAPSRRFVSVADALLLISCLTFFSLYRLAEATVHLPIWVFTPNSIKYEGSASLFYYMCVSWGALIGPGLSQHIRAIERTDFKNRLPSHLEEQTHIHTC